MTIAFSDSTLSADGGTDRWILARTVEQAVVDLVDTSTSTVTMTTLETYVVVVIFSTTDTNSLDNLCSVASLSACIGISTDGGSCSCSWALSRRQPHIQSSEASVLSSKY